MLYDWVPGVLTLIQGSSQGNRYLHNWVPGDPQVQVSLFSNIARPPLGKGDNLDHLFLLTGPLET